MAIPSRIGRYTVERLLGQGAMGCVYLARDLELERPVAIKTVKDLDLDEDRKQRFLDRFKNEARAAARLSHPAVVQVFDVGEDPDVGPFLVLEYVRGSSLKQILRERGALAPYELVAIAKELAQGIDLAHALGIIHRDIKPDNVLVADDVTTGGARAKLADFGVARVPNAALTKEGQFLGTPCYAAPETLASGTYGPKTDLFSFAAMLYELASGTRAFPGDEAIAVAHAVIHDEPPAPSTVAKGGGLPAAVDRVLLAALSKDPAGRPESASQLADDLGLAFGEAETQDGSTFRSQRTPVEPPRRPGALAGFLFVVMGALGVGLVLVLGNPLSLGLTGGGPEDAGASSLAMRDAGAALAALPPDAGVPEDAGPPPVDAPDGGRPDVGTPDAGRVLSRTEREDLAKDEIDLARDALAAGDREAARSHLDRARELDPESSDLEELEAALAGP